MLPRSLQLFIRRQVVCFQRSTHNNVWPIDKKAFTPPNGWSGWPDQKRFALILTHDVDTAIGQDKCKKLADLEEDLGFRSSFNFVPKRYNVSSELRQYLVNNGFEVGVHGLYHDGKLYKSEKLFHERATEINQYLEDWNAVGFRSPSMHHNLDWIHQLDIAYDASTFDTDPFEPQSDGVGTIYPFWVQGDYTQKGYVELPYTLPQDSTLFILMKERGVSIWKRKLDWIAKHGGMALVNTHPDYMNFNGMKLGAEEYPSGYYVELLEYIKSKYDGRYWHVLPKTIAQFFEEYAKNIIITTTGEKQEGSLKMG